MYHIHIEAIFIWSMVAIFIGTLFAYMFKTLKEEERKRKED